MPAKRSTKSSTARKSEAYVDTSALIAFTDRSDTHHTLFRRLFGDPPHLITTSLVGSGRTWLVPQAVRHPKRFAVLIHGGEHAFGDRSHRPGGTERSDRDHSQISGSGFDTHRRSRTASNVFTSHSCLLVHRFSPRTDQSSSGDLHIVLPLNASGLSHNDRQSQGGIRFQPSAFLRSSDSIPAPYRGRYGAGMDIVQP